MKSIDTNNYNVIELTDYEKTNVYGGSLLGAIIFSFIAGAVIGFIAYIVSNNN